MIRFIHLFLVFLALFAGNAQAVEIGRQIKLEAERPKPVFRPFIAQPSPGVLAALRFLTASFLQARVRDAAGNETLSAVLSFTVDHSRDNLAPSFSGSFAGLAFDSRDGIAFLVAPGQLIQNPQLVINALDNIQVSSIYVSIDGVLVAHPQGATADLSIDLATLADGAHALSLLVADTTGNNTAGPVIRFSKLSDTVPPSPVELFSNIQNPAAVRGEVQLYLAARDDQALGLLQLLLDGQLVRSFADCGSASTSLATDLLADGPHRLIVRALDASGNEAWSTPLDFTSDNPVSGFAVSPSYLSPGTPGIVTVSALLQQPRDWTVKVTGPNGFSQTLTGTQKEVETSLDLSQAKDGSYTVSFSAAGISGTWEKSLTVNWLTGPPLAQIDGLADGSRIENGLLPLKGIAADPDDEDAVAWKFVVSDREGNLIREVTPGTLDANGWHLGRVAATSEGGFGTLDFTLLRNGAYTLTLLVRGGNDTVSTSRDFVLDSELKIGHFSFSQQDLVLPVAGLPLSVKMAIVAPALYLAGPAGWVVIGAGTGGAEAWGSVGNYLATGESNYGAGDAALALIGMVPFGAWSSTPRFAAAAAKAGALGSKGLAGAREALNASRLAKAINCGPVARGLARNGWITARCFPGDTLASGKRMDQYHKDELLTAWDDAKKTFVQARITQIFVHEHDGEFAEVTLTSGASLKPTAEHPFRLAQPEQLGTRPAVVFDAPQEGTWVEARYLRTGDLLLTPKGAIAVASVRVYQDKIKVYNFEVEGLHNYTVGADGVVVHNACLQKQKALAQIVNHQATVVERWLGVSNNRWAKLYRASLSSSPNFAKGIRGRFLDIRTRNIFRSMYRSSPGIHVDKAVSGSPLRPDLFFSNLNKRKVIFDVGGKSKVEEIKKYTGKADDLIPLIPVQWVP